MTNTHFRRLLPPIIAGIVLAVLCTILLRPSTDLAEPEREGADRSSSAGASPSALTEEDEAALAKLEPEPRWYGVEGSIVTGGCMGMPGIQLELRTPEGEALHQAVTGDLGHFAIKLDRAVAKNPRLQLIVNPRGIARQWQEGTHDVYPDGGHRFLTLKPADGRKRALTLVFQNVPEVQGRRDWIYVEIIHPNGRSHHQFVKPSEPRLKLDRLDPGIYHACARIGDRVWAEPHIDLTENHDLHIDAFLNLGRRVVGRVVDETGAGVEGCKVQVFFDPHWENRSFSPGALYSMGMEKQAVWFAAKHGETDATGQFQFENCPPVGLRFAGESDELCLPAMKIEDQVEGTAVCDLGEVCLKPGDAKVSVVIDAPTSAVDGATLVLAGGLFGARRTAVKADRAAFKAVVPGDYLVCVCRESTAGGALFSNRLTDWQRISVQPGKDLAVSLRLLDPVQCEHK